MSTTKIPNPPKAYPVGASDGVAERDDLRELTLRGIILGALMTVVLTAANVYLGLRVALTFNTAIPAAVISMATLRAFKDSNILENTMVQTLASAAGTLSSVIFVIPGLVLIGYWQGFPFWQTAGICAIGGVLGVLYTVPLRRGMVAESDLVYPEGVAAAEILRVGSRARGEDGSSTTEGEPGVKELAIGSLISALAALCVSGFKIFADGAFKTFALGSVISRIGTGYSLAILGVGYIIGAVGGVAMLVGIFIAWNITIPILSWLHPAPAGVDLADYADGLWRHQVKFLGAGVIGIAAVWSLLKLMPSLTQGVRSALRAMRQVRAGEAHVIPRVERDIPFHYVIGLSLAMALPMAYLTVDFLLGQPVSLSIGMIAALTASAILYAFLFGFLIATTCGYMAGIVGSSNSPISGVGILGVVLVSLLLVLFVGRDHLAGNPEAAKGLVAFALFITSLILAIASISNNNLQDLKTGQLVGATPLKQQIALIIGVLVGAVIVPPVLDFLYNAYGFGDILPRPGMDPHQALNAPQATLMATIATGIIGGNLNWLMIEIGVGVGISLILIDWLFTKSKSGLSLPPLAVGIGIYLPISATMPIFIGAMIAAGTDLVLKRRARQAGQKFETYAELPRRRGVLLASGLIVGESVIGVAIAGIIGATSNQEAMSLVGPEFAQPAIWLGTIAFAATGYYLYRAILARPAVRAIAR